MSVPVKKPIALLLSLLLALSLCACGEKDDNGFRTLEVLGTKHYGTICRGGDKLAPVIDAAMATLAGNGTLAALSIRWLGSDRSCLEGDANAFAALEPDALPTARTLIVGVETDHYPLAYDDNGAVCGLCPDIADAIGALIGWETRVLCVSPDQVSTQLASGNVDCVLGFDPILVKASEYAVGSCFLESDIRLVVRADSEIRRTKDLKGARVGTVSDPAVLNAIRSSEKLTKYASGATEYLTLPRCMEAMDKGWCSAVAVDGLALSYYRAAPGSAS